MTQKTGTEWYSYFLIEEFKKIDLDNRFVLYSKNQLEGELGNTPSNFENKILSWPLGFFWTQIRLCWEVFFYPPEVFFIPAHTIPIFTRARTVMTVHDVGFKVYPELYKWYDILYHRFSIWWASRFADQIIVPSEFTKTELIKYYRTDSKKITVIPHGASLPPPGGGEVARKGGEIEPFLLYIGRLEKKKNILNIIKAFNIILNHYPDFKLVLAGRRGNEMEKINELIESLRLREKIEVLDYILEEKKVNLYKKASTFVFPTLYEGFGMPILEAQSYGCPVVTSNRGANAEVAGESAVLVDPDKPDEIAKGIERALVGERGGFIEKGFENVKKYSWRQSAEKTLNVLLKK